MKSIQVVLGLLFITTLLSGPRVVAQQAMDTDLTDQSNQRLASFEPQEGKHYISLNKYNSKEPTIVTSVKFYFWPASTSCYQLELALQKWQLKHPSIVIERIPLVKRPNWRLLAKAWLVANELNIAKNFLDQLYQAIHIQGSSIDNKAQLEDFLKSQDIDTLDFITLFNSPLINQQLKKLEIKSQLLPLQGVPSIIINEQWLTDASMVRTANQFLQLMDHLLNNLPKT